jgi:chromosome partitioning protein
MKQKTGKPDKNVTGKTVAKIYALAQQKGGVGKTTTTLNLAAALAEKKYRVLAVDFDPQGALTAGVGLAPLSIKETVYDLLIEPNFDIKQVIKATKLGFDLIPANLDLAAAEFELISEMGREHILKYKLALVQEDYEYILIDCPPSLGILTINALAAASKVIVPIHPQYFALRGMDLLFKTIERVKQRINPDLDILGILPTICDMRTNHTREVLEELQNSYKDLIFSTMIPQTIKLPDSTMAGESILTFAENSNAAIAYQQLAQEVINRGN